MRKSFIALATLTLLSTAAFANTGHLGNQPTDNNVTNVTVGDVENVMGNICNQSGNSNTCNLDLTANGEVNIADGATVNIQQDVTGGMSMEHNAASGSIRFTDSEDNQLTVADWKTTYDNRVWLNQHQVRLNKHDVEIVDLQKAQAQEVLDRIEGDKRTTQEIEATKSESFERDTQLSSSIKNLSDTSQANDKTIMDTLGTVSDSSIAGDKLLSDSIDSLAAKSDRADAALTDAIVKGDAETLKASTNYTDKAVAVEAQARVDGDEATLQESKAHTDKVVAVEEKERIAGDVKTLTESKSYTAMSINEQASLQAQIDLEQNIAYSNRMSSAEKAIYANTAVNQRQDKQLANHEARLGTLEQNQASMQNDIDTLYRGVAMSGALAMGSNLHTKAHNGNWTVTPSMAHYEGETALALQAQVAITDNWSARVGYANTTEDFLDVDKGIVGGAMSFSFGN